MDVAGHRRSDAFRVVGGHTDSPNLRVKQHHDIEHEGTAVLALEPYGGPLIGTWLDRDLGVAGHLVLRDGTERLVHVEEPVLRVPHLAIHLDRESKGSDIDPQRHLNAVWAIGSDTPFLSWLCEREGLRVDDVLGFELMAHDVQPSALVGANRELVSAPRLDNQATCFAGLQAILAAEPVDGVQPVLALFDHEEVGSTSQRGAQSDLLATVLERIVAGGRRHARRLPPRGRGVGVRVRRHGARDASQPRRQARTAAPHQRWAGDRCSR